MRASLFAGLSIRPNSQIGFKDILRCEIYKGKLIKNLGTGKIKLKDRFRFDGY